MAQIRKILFPLFLITSLSILNAEISINNFDSRDLENKCLEALKQKVTPETTVFAFDLHEVLFKKRVKNMVSTCFKVLAKGMIWYIFNPFFWCKVRSIKSTYVQHIMWEDFFKRLIKEYPAIEKFENDFYEIATSYEPVLPMIEILKELKNKGYKLFLLSNIGEETYRRHSKKFPEIMGYFDAIHIPELKNNYVHKPDEKYYIEFKNMLKELNLEEKQVIFIDDLKENIEGALKFNIACIHFTGFEQFKHLLESLNIL